MGLKRSAGGPLVLGTRLGFVFDKPVAISQSWQTCFFMYLAGPWALTYTRMLLPQVHVLEMERSDGRQVFPTASQQM